MKSIVDKIKIVKRIPKKIILVIKLLVTVLLCLLIIAKADFKNIANAFKLANLWLILVVLLCMFFNDMVVRSIRWKLLLRIHGLNYKIKDLAKYYLTALFLCNFLPSTIGGDGYRIYRIYKTSQSKAGSVLPILLDRIFGVSALCLLGLVAAIISYIIQGDDISFAGIFFGSIGSLIFFLMLSLLIYEKSSNWLLDRFELPNIIKKIIENLKIYVSHKKLVLNFIGAIIFFHLFLFFFWYVLFRGIGEVCPIFGMCLSIMISTVVAMLPISINGIGLMDGSFIYLITNFGVKYDSAVIFMIIHRSLTTGISLLGSIFYFIDKESIKTNNINKLDINFNNGSTDDTREIIEHQTDHTKFERY